ncbi:MAG TPA: ABC transporter permease [Actinomycetota bacterium]|jgi:peptide/nickel transport system permease protein|nr:ABC transporter permease [Actinomycetota bacterium]
MSAVDLEGTTAAATARPLRGEGLRHLVRRPAGVFGLVVVTLLLVLAIFAPQIAPQDPYEQDIADRFAASSSAHWMGTDELGRDTLSRLIVATRTAMLVALPAIAIALLLGVSTGLIAGYVGRWVDGGLVIVNDTLQAFPGLVLALVVIALLGPSLRNEVILIGLTVAPSYFRVTRASMLSAREEVYVDAERALGASTPRVLGHIMPNIVPPILVLVAMDIPGVIAIDAGLSFLGLGVQPPTPSWGVMLDAGFRNLVRSPWLVIFTSAALATATLGFTFLGEALREVFDPRTREAG